MDRDEIIRYLLGEMDAAEAERARAELARSALAGSDEDRAFAALVTQIRDGLPEAVGPSPLFEVSPEVLARLTRSTLGGRVPLGAAVSGVMRQIAAVLRVDTWLPGAAGPALARGGDGSRRLVFESEAGVMDVRIDPSSTRLSAYECVGKIEGTGSGSVVWRELDSGVEHEVALDADGFFECTVSGGTHQIELRLTTGTVLTPTVSHPARGSTA
jgi:hypothetical protein